MGEHLRECLPPELKQEGSFLCARFLIENGASKRKRGEKIGIEMETEK